MKKIVNIFSISSKLWLLSAGIFALIAGYQYYTLQLVQAQFENELFHKSDELIRQVSAELSTGLWLHQTDYVDRHLKALEKKPDISFLTLLDSGYTELYGFRSDAYRAQIDSFKYQPVARQDIAELLLIKQPVLFDGIVLGYLLSGFNRQWVQQRYAEKRQELLAATGIAALLLMIMTGFFSYLITRPIRKAIAGLQQAGEGGESQDFPLHTRGNGEIARLIDAFRRFSALTHRQLSEATGAQDYLETLFSLSPIPVLITDSAGKIERANQSAVTLFRIPLQQLQQRHLEELFGSSDYYTMKNHIDKSEEDLHGYVTVYISEQGERSVLELNIARLVNSAQKSNSLILTIIDVTEKIETQQEIQERQEDLAGIHRELEAKDRLLRDYQEQIRRLEQNGSRLPAASGQDLQAQKLESLGEIVGGIAHEFNNILGIMNPNIDLLLLRAKSDPEVARRLAVLQKAADRAAALTRRLMRFSRNQPLSAAPLTVNHLLLQFQETIQRSIGDKYQLRILLTPDLPEIYADKQRIRQMILNLALNARDAMPEGGIITIRTAQQTLASPDDPGAPQENFLEITVSDQGRGIPDDYLYKIFDPFFTTKAAGGKRSGLGLSEVYGIVKSHDGFITVETELNRGSSFHIYLKSYQPAKQRTAPAV